jgi:hypothetical protein
MTISASFPYGLKNWNSSSCDSSTASEGLAPGSPETNSTRSRGAGRRIMSSTHGRPLTTFARTWFHGFHHGLTGLSLMYSWSTFSISAVVDEPSWENLTNAPPSRMRGRTSVAVIGRFRFALAFSMIFLGSVPEMAGPTSLSSSRGAGIPRTLRMEIGKTLLKNRIPSLGPALMCPVLSSPAWSEA